MLWKGYYRAVLKKRLPYRKYRFYRNSKSVRKRLKFLIQGNRLCFTAKTTKKRFFLKPKNVVLIDFSIEIYYKKSTDDDGNKLLYIRFIKSGIVDFDNRMNKFEPVLKTLFKAHCLGIQEDLKYQYVEYILDITKPVDHQMLSISEMEYEIDNDNFESPYLWI